MESQKCRRRRVTSVKRWPKESKDLLLALIKKQMEEDPSKFERPTAPMFYSKMIEKYPIFREFGWKGMRDKIRNMRTKYKISKYQKLQLCEDYDMLDSIFDVRKNSIPSYLPESNGSSSSNNIGPTEEDAIQEFEFDLASQTVSCVMVKPEVEDPLNFSQPAPKKQCRLSANNSTTVPPEIQKDKTEYLREKLNFLKEIEERKLQVEFDKIAIKREKVDLERERLKEEIRLREFELQNEYKLRELELKYKYNKE